MNLAEILNLSTVLFKSYLRGGRSGRVNLFSQPRVMLIIDLTLITVPLALLQYLLPQLPADLKPSVGIIAVQALVGLPILLTSAIILSGILFELGQNTGTSSTEPVNWLPISPREYVAASSLSTITVYSPILALGLGVTLPLALATNHLHLWFAMVPLSLLAFLLGAFIVEILKATTNRVSSTVYKRSGRLGIITRLVLLTVLFIAVQLAFNPIILYQALNLLVGGVGLFWFIPMVWPSIALINTARLEAVLAGAFSVLSLVFTSFVFELASNLRFKYWSSSPLLIAIAPASGYAPRVGLGSRFGYNALESALASKEFRALIRRKDMARFIAIPALLIISFMLPTFMGSDYSYSGSSPGLFVAVFIPFMLPLMFSMISVGHEGKEIVNLYMLPITAKELIKGKLLPACFISAVATTAVVVLFEILAPMGVHFMLAALFAGLLLIPTEALIGLGVGSRFPDFRIRSNSSYVKMRGFLLGFLLGGLAALAVFGSIALSLISSGGVRGPSSLQPVSLALTLPITVVAGLILGYISYRWCRKGVEHLISDMKN